MAGSERAAISWASKRVYREMMGSVEEAEEGREFDSESEGESEGEGESTVRRASLLCDIISTVPRLMVSPMSSTA